MVERVRDFIRSGDKVQDIDKKLGCRDGMVIDPGKEDPRGRRIMNASTWCGSDPR